MMGELQIRLELYPNEIGTNGRKDIVDGQFTIFFHDP